MPALRLPRPLAAAAVLAALALPALALPSSALAQDPARIPAGVVAGGVDLGGLTVSEAADRLSAQLSPRLTEPVVVRVAGRRFTLDPAITRLTLDPTATARRALAAGGTPQPITGGGTPVGALVPLAIRHARIPVKAFAGEVEAQIRRAPRNAELRIGLKRMHVRRARLGVSLDTAALAARIDAVLDDPATSRLVEQRVTRTRPEINANDLRAQYRTVITVSKREFRLRLFKNLRISKTYPVAIGQPAYPTPVGRFAITDKQIDPVWSVPNSPWAGELGGSTVAGGSAANPLKARWMGIVDGVGIHGTGEDWSIGSAASHGCLRMHVWHVKDLYPRVPVGTTVVIR